MPTFRLNSRKEAAFSSEKWEAALGRCVLDGFNLFNTDFDVFQACHKKHPKLEASSYQQLKIIS